MQLRRLVLSVLLGVVVASLPGCTGEEPTPVDPQLAADHTALTTALDLETALAEQLRKLGSSAPQGAADVVGAHVAALTDSIGGRRSAAPSPSTGTTPPPATTPPLGLGLRSAAASHLEALADVTGPTARLLASVAASDLALAEQVGAPLGDLDGLVASRLARGAPDATGTVEAWRSVVNLEQQAVYGYQVAAAQLRADGVAAARALTSLTAHRSRLGTATAAMVDAGLTPEAPAPGYALPSPVTGLSGAVTTMTAAETACATGYASLVAASAPDARLLPAAWLTAAAQRTTQLTEAVPHLPGL